MRYNILIVEDSRLINDNLKKTLEADGHTVTQSFDIAGAIPLFQSHRFDYVLLDLILPDGDGELLLAYAKRADARVIVMTTDRDSFRRDRLFGFGIVDYIIKERYFEDIVESIRKIMAQVESNSEFTLLVVDDSNFIRNNLELLLHNRGFLVLTATNGEEALDMMERYKIDALLADLEMPVIDGLSLLGKIRRKSSYKKLPVMILTESNDHNLIAKVIKHDVRDVIKKPYVIEEMLLKVDNVMNSVKNSRLIGEERWKFDLYYEAISHSTLFMKLSPELKVVEMNTPLSELVFGSPPDPFTPIPLKDLVKNPTLELFRSILKVALGTPPIQYIFMFEEPGQPACYVSATLSGIFNANGSLREIVFIGQDITRLQTDQQYLQKQLTEQMTINLEQQQMIFSQAKMAAMGEMIGNIAHQWRQPLNALGLIIQDMEEAYNYGELDGHYMQNTIHKSMQQIQFMSKTIDDFRNFFQPGKLKERFDLSEAVYATTDILSAMLKSHHIDLIYEIPKGKNCTIEGYRSEFQQVILNLLGNAKDAICAAGKSGNRHEKWIRLSLQTEGDMLILGIEDSGGGIPEDIMERIFEPYFTTKEENKGTGIGLYMSKMIIEENMQGELRVENTVHGALFRIILHQPAHRAGELPPSQGSRNE